MEKTVISVFGCDWDERLLFERYASRYGIEVLCFQETLGTENVRDVPPGSAVSVNHKSPVGTTLIRMLRKRGVAYLSSRSVGLDHIDRAAAERAGLTVESVAYSPESVAEFAIMLILMALRSAGSVLRRVEAGDFRLEPRRGRELRDMTVGVIGTGRIGKKAIERLSGFQCKILAYDPHPDAKVSYMEMDELLSRSDLVTLHLPLTANTRHLLSRARIEGMKRGAIVVNAARGALIDTNALADALESGRLACAALDVVEGEEGWFYEDCAGRGAPPFQRLMELPNAIVTPHTAFYTEHALCDVVRNTLQNCLEQKGALKQWIS